MKLVTTAAATAALSTLTPNLAGANESGHAEQHGQKLEMVRFTLDGHGHAHLGPLWVLGGVHFALPFGHDPSKVIHQSALGVELGGGFRLGPVELGPAADIDVLSDPGGTKLDAGFGGLAGLSVPLGSDDDDELKLEAAATFRFDDSDELELHSGHAEATAAINSAVIGFEVYKREDHIPIPSQESICMKIKGGVRKWILAALLTVGYCGEDLTKPKVITAGLEFALDAHLDGDH